MAKVGEGTTGVRNGTPQPAKANGTPSAASGGVDDILRFSHEKNTLFSLLFYRKRACSECSHYALRKNIFGSLCLIAEEAWLKQGKRGCNHF